MTIVSISWAAPRAPTMRPTTRRSTGSCSRPRVASTALTPTTVRSGIEWLSRSTFWTSRRPDMKGKRTDLGNADCGIARSLQIIGDWWSLLIVREAFQGKTRFGEFQKSIGLAKNILSSRLKKLVAEGIFRIEIGRAHV